MEGRVALSCLHEEVPFEGKRPLPPNLSPNMCSAEEQHFLPTPFPGLAQFQPGKERSFSPNLPPKIFPGRGRPARRSAEKRAASPPNLILGMPYGGRPALTVKLFPRPVHPRLVEERSSLLEFYFGMPLGEKLPSLLNSLCAPNLRHPREGGCRHETSREPSPKNRREGRPERVGRLGKQSLTYYVSVVFSERVVTVL